MSPSRIIKIGNRKYLAGLSWRSSEDVHSLDELRQMGEGMFDGAGAKWYVRRHAVDEMVMQVGFSVGSDDKKPSSAFSLAHQAAAVRSESWIGIYQISEDLWWYVAVMSGGILLPDGDVIGGEQTVQELRDHHLSIGKWDLVEGGIEDLESLISSCKESPARIKGLGKSTRFPSWAPMAGAALLIAAAVGGYYFYDQYQKKVQLERYRTAKLMADKQREASKKGNFPVAEINLPPYPLPDEWVSECLADTSRIKISQSGWQIKDFSCNAKTGEITTSWKRGDGATIAHRPDGALSADGDFVAQTAKMGNVSQATTLVNGLPQMEETKNALLLLSQKLGVKIDVQDVARHVSAVLPGQSASDSTVPASVPIQAGSFSFSLDFFPSGMSFDRIAGLQIDALTFDGGKWLISGVFHGR